MAAGGKIRVGIVGANPSRGFASIAHIPALKALAEFEISAVCTTRQDSADAAAKHFGVPLAFCDAEKLARHPDVDLVTVSVKVPDHYVPVMAAIEAGKHVYCEWPLGRDADEAARMLDAARGKGIRHAVGLQGQMSPAICYARDLIADGYVGRVLSATMIGCAPNWGPTIDRAYQADRANGANLLTITGGHTIDALCYCLGEFRELAAFVVSQRDRISVEETDEMIAKTSPDQLVVNGIAGNGAIVSSPRRRDARHPLPVRDPWRGRRPGAAPTTRNSMQRQTLVLKGGTRRWYVARRAAGSRQIPLGAGWCAGRRPVQCRPALREARRIDPRRHADEPRL